MWVISGTIYGDRIYKLMLNSLLHVAYETQSVSEEVLGQFCFVMLFSFTHQYSYNGEYHLFSWLTWLFVVGFKAPVLYLS